MTDRTNEPEQLPWGVQGPTDPRRRANATLFDLGDDGLALREYELLPAPEPQRDEMRPEDHDGSERPTPTARRLRGLPHGR